MQTATHKMTRPLMAPADSRRCEGASAVGSCVGADVLLVLGVEMVTDMDVRVADVPCSTGLEASNLVNCPLLTPAVILLVILDDTADVSVPEVTGTRPWNVIERPACPDDCSLLVVSLPLTSAENFRANSSCFSCIEGVGMQARKQASKQACMHAGRQRQGSGVICLPVSVSLGRREERRVLTCDNSTTCLLVWCADDKLVWCNYG